MKDVVVPRVLKACAAAAYVGGRLNLQRLEAAGWVAPLAGKQRGVDFDRQALDRALDRVAVTGWPGEENANSSHGKAVG
jgi:hypothetical protein